MAAARRSIVRVQASLCVPTGEWRFSPTIELRAVHVSFHAAHRLRRQRTQQWDQGSGTKGGYADRERIDLNYSRAILIEMLNEIYEFRRITDKLGTGGQPTEAQFSEIRNEGFEVVVNLALPTSDNAIANEGSVVTALGMTYIHIPVNFANPTANDFQAFCGIMDALHSRKVFVHCAANKRVSAFIYLRRVLKQGHDAVAAKAEMDALWQPDCVWTRFIDDQLRGR
jgi:protein tyrosine phosphatase (PTP) superfamily phosphohydrolase (DUF442 family)